MAICIDIMFIVTNLNQFLEQPSCIVRQQNVLKYLKGTIGFGIEFGSTNQPNILIAYSDADYGSCVDSRKLSSGVMLNAKAV